MATLTGHTREIVGLFWSSDSSWLTTASADRTLRLWSAGQFSGEPLGPPISLWEAPLSMAGAAASHLVALGLPEMLIQVLQLASEP